MAVTFAVGTGGEGDEGVEEEPVPQPTAKSVTNNEITVRFTVDSSRIATVYLLENSLKRVTFARSRPNVASFQALRRPQHRRGDRLLFVMLGEIRAAKSILASPSGTVLNYQPVFQGKYYRRDRAA